MIRNTTKCMVYPITATGISLSQRLFAAVQTAWKLWVTSHLIGIREKQESNYTSKTFGQKQSTELKHSRWQQAPFLLSSFFCLIQPRKLFRQLEHTQIQHVNPSAQHVNPFQYNASSQHLYWAVGCKDFGRNINLFSTFCLVNSAARIIQRKGSVWWFDDKETLIKEQKNHRDSTLNLRWFIFWTNCRKFSANNMANT